MMEIADPIFVVGVGRSGTTLVQAMLASHPDIAFPPETSFFRRYVVRGTLGHLAEKEGRRAVIKRLGRDRLFQRTGISPGALVERALQSRQLSDAGLYRVFLALTAEQNDVARVGDKDPRLIEHLSLVSRAFPDAWIVHVIRDPRDVLASKKRTAWSRGHHLLHHLLAGSVQVAMGKSDGPSHFGARYLELYYEQLVAHPEQTMRNLCNGLDVEFDQGMLQHRTAAERLVSDDERAWKETALGPLVATKTGEWKRSLSEWEIAVTEFTCKEAMESGRYEPSSTSGRLGFGLRSLAAVAAGLIRVAGEVYMLVRRWRDQLVSP